MARQSSVSWVTKTGTLARKSVPRLDTPGGLGNWPRHVVEGFFHMWDLAKPVITTCGSGVTACILGLALERLGKTDYAIYDGSWSEWGLSPTLPIATGDA